MPSLRRVVAALDRNLPVADVRTLEDVVAAALADRRLAMALFGVFSVLSLVLAALGLYAVISYMVVQRRQEIGRSRKGCEQQGVRPPWYRPCNP